MRGLSVDVTQLYKISKSQFQPKVKVYGHNLIGKEKVKKHIYHYNFVVNNSIEEIPFSKNIKMNQKNSWVISSKEKAKRHYRIFMGCLEKRHNIKSISKSDTCKFQVRFFKKSRKKEKKRERREHLFAQKGVKMLRVGCE